MTKNFKLYSQYYDLLYRDKNYLAETDYVINLINEYRPDSKSIVELGSGTGKHADLLSKRGYQLVGIERSQEMVEIANKNKKGDVDFKIADITNFEIRRSFDIALSLFHVISYLTDNQSLINTFKNVHHHLNNAGLFIFDIWHSPAVYTQVPGNRIKVLRNERIEIVRHAHPVIDLEHNVVEVNYKIEVKQLEKGTISIIQEKHPMRHFSKPEIELLAYSTGFEVVHSEEFFSKAPPSDKTWGVCYILRKK